MAKVQTKKININDFSAEARADIAKLARSLNPFFDDIERAFRKGLTVEDNLPFQYVTFNVEVDIFGTPKQKTSFSFSLTNLKGCVTVDAKPQDNVSFPVTTPFVSYTTSGSIITVANVAGLPADKAYTITLMLMA